MKAKLALLLIPAFVLLGCADLNKLMLSDYYRVTSASSNDSYTTAYSIVVVNNQLPTGYYVKADIPSPTFTFTTKPLDLTVSDEATVLPAITFNRMAVDYTVTGDTQGNIIGTWNPTPVDTGVNITLPSRGANDTAFPTVTMTVNNIASEPLAKEVFAKIGTVTPVLRLDGTYSYQMDLGTALTVRADVTFYGSDDHWQELTHKLSTTLYFSQ